MTKILYLIDPGHGGLNEKGEYVTPGKRSPLFDDGKTILYEGVNNRINKDLVLKKASAMDIKAIDLLEGSNKDVPLTTRCKTANIQSRANKCAVISIHSDAAGNDGKWSPASGISVWTSPGQTKSDILASIMIHEFERQFGNTVKWRKDTRDGDEDQEAHFQILTGTTCPAILIEAGFHTNKEEAAKMLTNEWREKLSTAIVNAMIAFDKLQ